MAEAAIELAARSLAESRSALRGQGKRGELVEVVPRDLDLGHPRPCVGRKAVLDHLPGGQQGGRVQGEHAEAVERHRSPQDPRRGLRERADVVAAVSQQYQAFSKALESDRRHGSVVAVDLRSP
jgi:hypothetical protein